MHNYEHEIPCPDDRAMRKFLWDDYFRDSVIESVDFDRERKECVVMRLRCDREERACWNKFYEDYDKWYTYIQENADKFTYLLRFHRVAFFERRVMTGELREFVNARFKDTALLRRLQKQSEQRLYHLRIQTSCGLIDLIFGGFEIRKVKGRVSYAPVRDVGRPLIFSGERRLRAEIRAEEYSGMPEDDFDRFLVLMDMDLKGNDHLTEAVQTCMNEKAPCEDAKPYAAHLLGRIGKPSDIPALIKLLFEAEEELANNPYEYRKLMLHRQNIFDAIEFVRYRAREAEKGDSSCIAD